MRISIRMGPWLNRAKEEGKPFQLEAFLRDAKEADYDGVDLYGGKALLGASGKVRQLVAKHGLEISACGTGVTYNPYPPNSRQYRSDMRHGRALGVHAMMVTGGFNYYGRRNQYPADYDLFGHNLGAAISYAARLGLEIAYYPHRGAIVETAAETRLLIQRLPGLKLCPDVAQLEASGDDAVRFIRTFKDRIINAYLADFDVRKNEFKELGKGRSRLVVADCVRALVKNGYDGWLTVALGRTSRPLLASARVSRCYLRECGV